MQTPLIIGHRGAARFFPENTLPSFQAAFESVRAVEFDLWLSKDGIPFVFHDAKLERTTDGSGYAVTKTMAELHQLDAGFRFDPRQDKSFPFRGQGIKIPSFEELLESFTGKSWCVEIKQNSAELVHKAVKLLEKKGGLRDCVIGSMHHLVSETMRRDYSGIPRFFSQRDMVGAYFDFKRGISPQKDAFAAASMPPRARCGLRFDEPGFIEYLHAKQTRVFYWTINDEIEMKRLAGLGADGLITDDPALGRKVFF